MNPDSIRESDPEGFDHQYPLFMRRMVRLDAEMTALMLSRKENSPEKSKLQKIYEMYEGLYVNLKRKLSDARRGDLPDEKIIKLQEDCDLYSMMIERNTGALEKYFLLRAMLETDRAQMPRYLQEYFEKRAIMVRARLFQLSNAELRTQRGQVSSEESEEFEKKLSRGRAYMAEWTSTTLEEDMAEITRLKGPNDACYMDIPPS